MRSRRSSTVPLLLPLLLLLGCSGEPDLLDPGTEAEANRTNRGRGHLDPELVAEGKDIFRHDTFGDEQFWTDVLGLHEVIQAQVSPEVALAVGLKVDADALPPGLLASVDLTDPATTVALIDLDAVVGVRGTVDAGGDLTSVGVTCALCHSTVDDAVAPGIGSRLDGWPNRDLDPGAILALSPFFSAAEKAVLQSWGPGRYDPYWNHDGNNDPVLIPPAYGLRGVPLETYTGEGPISYWNAYVAVTQMGGQGTFIEPDLGISVVHEPDLVTPKLPALRAYQLSLEAPPPPSGTFDPEAARRGKGVFAAAGCVRCHLPPTYTDAHKTLHDPADFFTDPFYASRGMTGMWRTTPLRGLWQHPPYFHDGSAADLAEVVEQYDAAFDLGLSAEEKADLVQFLLTL